MDPITHRPFSTHVNQPDNTGWQNNGAYDEHVQTEQVDRLFPGYDLFSHDRNEDFDLPGIYNTPQPHFTDED